MGNYVYSVHNRLDDKLYNILGRGDLPCVVFGRVLKRESVPGMQYYFPDGKVKWHEKDSTTPYYFVKPYKYNDEDEEDKWGRPCIFTVPENFDYARLSDVDYVKQYSRTAINLNAKTTSPYYIIQNGHIRCIKPLDAPGKCVIVATKKRTKNGWKRRVRATLGVVEIKYRLSFILNKTDGDNGIITQTKCKPNKFVLIPVGRVKYEKYYKKSGTYRTKYNTTGERHLFRRFTKFFIEGSRRPGRYWKLIEI